LRQGETKTRGGQAHRFGGDWTDEKLAVIAHYLASYTTALKDKPSKEHPFRKGYIDAFAGTGYRFARHEDEAGDSQAPLLPDLAEKEPQALLDGSARIALKTEPRFDRYVFADRAGNKDERQIRAGALRKLQCRKAVERRKFVIGEDQIDIDVFKSGQELSAGLDAGYFADEMIDFKELLNKLRVTGLVLQQEDLERIRHGTFLMLPGGG